MGDVRWRRARSNVALSQLILVMVLAWNSSPTLAQPEAVELATSTSVLPTRDCESVTKCLDDTLARWWSWWYKEKVGDQRDPLFKPMKEYGQGRFEVTAGQVSDQYLFYRSKNDGTLTQCLQEKGYTVGLDFCPSHRVWDTYNPIPSVGPSLWKAFRDSGCVSMDSNVERDVEECQPQRQELEDNDEMVTDVIHIVVNSIPLITK
eukprot:GFYU01000023.1.p1 GENE.GFYU01000023.1~~GFYU01000023.1.p1  ORF type:complete len:205 (+),score=27.36 GFYU01000023.1:102-716(+)